MRFKMYEISCIRAATDLEGATVYPLVQYINITPVMLFRLLDRLPLLKDEDASEYAINDMDFYEHIVTGTFTQSYDISLTKFEGSKEEVPINESKANDKTYFFIDTRKMHLYIQMRKYQPKELNPQKTLKRFERVLNIIFRDFIIDPISLEPVKIEYTIDDIFHIFKVLMLTHVVQQ